MKVIIEATEISAPCLVLVLLLPQRVEPKRTSRRVIQTTGETLSDAARPRLRKAIVQRAPLLLAASK